MHRMFRAMKRGNLERRASGLRRIERAMGDATVRCEPLEGRVLLSLTSAISFAAPFTIGLSTTGYPATALGVGDVNGDGIPDVAAVRLDTTLQVFTGTKTGTLNLGPIVGTGGHVMALGDFNNDQKLDLAAGSGVLLGKGDGTFQAAKPGFTLPTNTVSIFTGDFNHDGNLDLAAATYNPATAQGSPATIGLTIFLGKGDGTFSGSVNTTVGSGANLTGSLATFATGDFNGDGVLDVLSPFGVSLGKGDGSFAAPIPLPVSPSTNPPAPASPIFAVGDFNGDKILDIATIPAAAPSGLSSGTANASIEILWGKGNGTFIDKGPVSLGKAASITALSAQDLNQDGRLDLLAGLSATGSSASIAALPGNGNGTFAAPNFATVAGAPLSFAFGDFDGNGKPDVVSLLGAANVAPTITGTQAGVSATVLLNTSPGPVTPTITLGVPRNVLSGQPTQLTATLAVPAGDPAPTGSVTFFDNGAQLGVAQVQGNVATLITSGIGVGQRSLTATYSGDANYVTANAAAVAITALLTTAKTPLLVPSVGAITLPSQFLPGDIGSAAVNITDGGGLGYTGPVTVRLYLSRSGKIDSSAQLLNVVTRRITVPSGQSVTINPPFRAGVYPAGGYVMLAALAPAGRLTAAQVSTTPAASPSNQPFVAERNVFGTVGTHTTLNFTAIDAAGNKANFWITGPGQGVVNSNSAGQVNVTVTGSTTATAVHVQTVGGAFGFGTINVSGSLRYFDGSDANITGDVTITGAVSLFALKSASVASTISGAPTPRPPGGNPPGGPPIRQTPQTIISLGGAETSSVSLDLGTMNGVTIKSTQAIGKLSAVNLIGGQVIAPWINNFDVTGTMSTDVGVHVGQIVNARLNTVTGGTWSVAGGLGTLRVAGNVAGARLFVGADSGADNILGTSDDAYNPATIGTITINGSVSGTTIAAGAVPAPGRTILQGLLLLPQGAIHTVTVRGSVSADSRFLASTLPVTAILAGQKIATASDPHFQNAG